MCAYTAGDIVDARWWLLEGLLGGRRQLRGIGLLRCGSHSQAAHWAAAALAIAVFSLSCDLLPCLRESQINARQISMFNGTIYAQTVFIFEDKPGSMGSEADLSARTRTDFSRASACCCFCWAICAYRAFVASATAERCPPHDILELGLMNLS